MVAVGEATPIAGEVPEGVARTAEVVVEVTITAVAEIAATMIVTIPGIGTAEEEEGTAARTMTIARPGTITTGTRDRTRAREVEEVDTTSGTIRTRTTGIVARRTGSALVRTTLRREVAAEITVPEVTAAAITIVAATEVLPVGTMTARRPMTNATAVAEPAPEMITTLRRAEEQEQANGLITAAAAVAAEEAESVAVTSPVTRWDLRDRWDRREFRVAGETPAR